MIRSEISQKQAFHSGPIGAQQFPCQLREVQPPRTGNLPDIFQISLWGCQLGFKKEQSDLLFRAGSSAATKAVAAP
jgi:hypothetical protein